MPCGIVKSKQGNTAMVVFERQDMCGDCHACEMISGKKDCKLTCRCEVACEIGDRVEVALASNQFLKATYIMYGIPLVGLIVGMLVGDKVGRVLESSQEIGAMVGAVCGILAGFLVIKYREKQHAYEHYLPRVIGKKD